jgi:hypothetical protein
MTFFRKAAAPQKMVSCEDVVNAYSAKLQSGRVFEDESALPFHPELIKAALVYTAFKNGSVEAIDAAKTGFVLLNNYVGKSKHMDLASNGEAAVHAALDREQDSLLSEFNARIELSQRLQHA